MKDLRIKYARAVILSRRMVLVTTINQTYKIIPRHNISPHRFVADYLSHESLFDLNMFPIVTKGKTSNRKYCKSKIPFLTE